MTNSIRVLLLADTHLGFDFPLRPRVERRRRGPDFFANTRRALEPARAQRVDLVVHGGDLLFRSKVPPQLVSMAFEPLLEVADVGVPVVLVPGNHERSAIPYPLLAAHENLHIIDRPKSINLEIRGSRVAVAGFPCVRNSIRDSFSTLSKETGISENRADVKLLCLHQTVEGATVGPSDFVFRSGPDIIRGCDLPGGLAAVLSGHIHRPQILDSDLAGRPFATPVYYPGSVERTSFAERDEHKGYFVVECAAGGPGGRVVGSTFHKLPARPLERLVVETTGRSHAQLVQDLEDGFSDFDHDAVVQVRFTGDASLEARPVLKAAVVREIAPSSMTVNLARPRS